MPETIINTFKFFQVPIGNSKCVENFKFHNDAPMLKYCQNLLNRFCFSGLASAFYSIESLGFSIIAKADAKLPKNSY